MKDSTLYFWHIFKSARESASVDVAQRRRACYKDSRSWLNFIRFKGDKVLVGAAVSLMGVTSLLVGIHVIIPSMPNWIPQSIVLSGMVLFIALVPFIFTLMIKAERKVSAAFYWELVAQHSLRQIESAGIKKEFLKRGWKGAVHFRTVERNAWLGSIALLCSAWTAGDQLLGWKEKTKTWLSHALSQANVWAITVLVFGAMMVGFFYLIRFYTHITSLRHLGVFLFETEAKED